MDSARLEKFQNITARRLVWSTIYNSYLLAMDTISSLIFSQSEQGSMSEEHTEVNFNCLEKFSDDLICMKEASFTRKGSQG